MEEKNDPVTNLSDETTVLQSAAPVPEAEQAPQPPVQPEWQAPQAAPAQQNWQAPQPPVQEVWQAPQAAPAQQNWQAPQPPVQEAWQAPQAAPAWQQPEEPYYGAQPQQPYDYGQPAPGYAPQPEQPKKKKKTGLIIAILLIVLVLIGGGVFAAIKFLVPMTKYKAAEKLLEEGKYDEAYSAFEELEDYEDSARKMKEVRYKQAEALLEEGNYDEAYKKFEALKDFSESKKMLKETRFRQAKSQAEKKKYKSAYETFLQIADYEGVQAQLDSLMGKWAKAILDGSTEDTDFPLTAAFTEEQAASVYEAVDGYIKEHETASMDEWRGTLGATVKPVADALPESFKDSRYIQQLLTWFASSDSNYAFYKQNRAAISALWDSGWIENLLKDGDAFTGFLTGNWETSDGDYHFTVTERSDSSYNANYNLPWVTVPSGNVYFDIDDFVFFYKDDNNNRLADVYKFKLITIDKIEIYCYKDSSNHTLTR